MMINENEIELKPLLDEDIPLFSAWFDKEYIKIRLGVKEDWLNEINNRNEPKYSFMKHFIVYHKERKIGFCLYCDCSYFKDLEESYDISFWQDMYTDVTEKNHTYEIGYFIGEEEYLNKGISKMVIRKLEEKIIKLGGRVLSADPAEDNVFSVKALLSCGFRKKNDGDYRKVISGTGDPSLL